MAKDLPAAEGEVLKQRILKSSFVVFVRYTVHSKTEEVPCSFSSRKSNVPAQEWETLFRNPFTEDF